MAGLFENADMKQMQRVVVSDAYKAAESNNKMQFLKGEVRATKEYIFDNQKNDAKKIMTMFYDDKNLRVVSIQKETKVGADGLMIETAKLMTTHEDDSFLTNCDNIRICTGMSNTRWATELKDKAPSVFKNKIFHHGQLQKMDLPDDLRDAFIIIDEIDTGNKENHKLTKILKESEILNGINLVEKNIRVMLISATMFRELHDLKKWGGLHKSYKMTIPENYAGAKYFLEKGFIKEWYPLNSEKNAERWVKEINDQYGDDFRVSLVRVWEGKKKNTREFVENACKKHNVRFILHTSEDRIPDKEYNELFVDPLPCHIVLGIKGFLRRADLIPTEHKLRIGAVHEMYTAKVDNNTQVQAFIGRMTGYWKDFLEAGHIMGPIRTSIKGIEEYINKLEYPDGDYQCSGLVTKKRETRTKGKTALNMPIATNLPDVEVEDENAPRFKRDYKEFATLDEMNKFIKDNIPGSHKKKTRENDSGFKICATTGTPGVQSYEDIMRLATSSNTLSNMPITKKEDFKNVGDKTHRWYVCYKDINDKNTELYVIIWVVREK